MEDEDEEPISALVGFSSAFGWPGWYKTTLRSLLDTTPCPAVLLTLNMFRVTKTLNHAPLTARTLRRSPGFPHQYKPLPFDSRHICQPLSTGIGLVSLPTTLWHRKYCAQSTPNGGASPAASLFAPSWFRPYQAEALQTCIKALQQGRSRITVSLPTGSGKTAV
jgi:hypothetical protein